VPRRRSCRVAAGPSGRRGQDAAGISFSSSNLSDADARACLPCTPDRVIISSVSLAAVAVAAVVRNFACPYGDDRRVTENVFCRGPHLNE